MAENNKSICHISENRDITYFIVDSVGNKKNILIESSFSIEDINMYTIKFDVFITHRLIILNQAQKNYIFAHEANSNMQWVITLKN